MPLPIHFAPLQGFTEYAYRNAHASICGGVASYYTPFLRLEHGQIRRRDIRDISAERNAGINVVPQVIAADSREFETLCNAAADIGYRHINLNMGCPFPMQTRSGRGTGLITRPDAVMDICRAISRISSESGIAFSIKMRLGHENANDWKAIIGILNDTPLEHIIMHPRIGIQQYKGELDMEAFAEFTDACKHPIIFNGDISTPEDIRSLEASYPNLKGIMAGRGLLHRPTLAQEYASGKVASDTEVRDAILRIHADVLAEYERTLEGGDNQILMKIQPFWEYPGPLFDRKIIKKLSKTGTLAAYKKILEGI